MLRRSFFKSTAIAAAGAAAAAASAAGNAKPENSWRKKYASIKYADVVVVGAGPKQGILPKEYA